MAIPAFQKVRQSSQDKAVLNNARQLSAASDQFFLENGVSTCASTDLVGATNYVKALNTVASELYPTGFTQGITITISGVAGVRTVTYSP
jgi:type IV pilus assembly protein PilA